MQIQKIKRDAGSAPPVYHPVYRPLTASCCPVILCCPPWGNMDNLYNSLQEDLLNLLRERLPPGWTVEPKPLPTNQYPVPDFILELSGPGKERTTLLVEMKGRLEPKDVDLGDEARLTLERFAELRGGAADHLDEPDARAIVRELKAVGGNLKLLRLALTGAERGPELWTVVAAVPRDEALRRAAAAITPR